MELLAGGASFRNSAAEESGERRAEETCSGRELAGHFPGNGDAVPRGVIRAAEGAGGAGSAHPPGFVSLRYGWRHCICISRAVRSARAPSARRWGPVPLLVVAPVGGAV
ncbi:hypothetical protein NL676_027691 [Syzygium grande]|nr:hypothetical protein NL676_027691 [Syzygium grande]